MNKISIKPEREYLREIVTKIESGEYAIPAFQRDFVWKKTQILELFDSISKGYPIGSIILWKPKNGEVPPVKNIITEEVSEDDRAEYFLLDGRQRATAFMGCVSDWENKSPLFQLYYDLASECFAFPSRRRSKSSMFLVSDIFDTFKMLGTLQRVMEMRIPEDTKRNYISRIKEINTILQTYEIGEMMIENCTLDESSTVFSRINSKGTDISRVEMLQALTYKNRSSILLAEKIDEIISSLSVYGFANMKPDDILNCCAKYIGKNFYDNNLMDILAKEDFSQFIDQLRVNVTKAVRFLNEECHVISYKLLPYNRQLIAIANFFKEKSNPSQEELAELKRWFFYTTYQQSFQNSSLGNVRSIFTRFDEFVRGDTLEAIDYHPIEIDSLMDIKFSTSSAMSNFVVLCQIAKRKSLDSSENMSYIGEYKYSGDKVSGVFALLNSDDRNIINAIIRGEEIEDDLTKYLLNDDIVTSMRNKDVFQVRRQRRRFIVDEIVDFLHSLALVLEGDDEQPNNVIEQPSNDIDELISEFEDLNNEEKRELCSILSSGNEASSVIFTIEKSEDGNVLISYPSFSNTYVLTPHSSTTCLRKIETMFCNGEDAEGYYSWRLALDKDD